jgi:hypothetical protein
MAAAGTPLAVTRMALAFPATAVADDEEVNAGPVPLAGVTGATGGLTGLTGATGTTGGLPGLTGVTGAAAATDKARVWVLVP